jgi:hypothetical protein
MPDLPPSMPSPAVPSGLEAAASSFDDLDYALGCECADPSLQIERWGQEAASDGA